MICLTTAMKMLESRLVLTSRRKKMTLPLIYALNNASFWDRRIIYIIKTKAKMKTKFVK